MIYTGIVYTAATNILPDLKLRVRFGTSAKSLLRKLQIPFLNGGSDLLIISICDAKPGPNKSSKMHKTLQKPMVATF